MENRTLAKGFRVAGTLLLLAGLFWGRLPKTQAAAEIPSYTLAAEDFESGVAARVLPKGKPRLITVEGFHAQKLDNDRSLYLYLPPSYYAKPASQYPVLYVQDGKGVFYASDWSKESLEMHLTVDALIETGRIEELIIVAISNMGQERSSEFAHWDGFDGGWVKAKGDLYEDFILKDVMPFLNAHFNVKQGRENTAIMGASMGGLVSFNIGMKHPDLFSKIALQSPFLGWGEERLLDKIQSGEYTSHPGMKLWMDIGASEEAFLAPLKRVVQALLAQGHTPMDTLAVLEVPGGKHSEASWGQRAEDILLYFYGNPGAPAQVELVAPARLSISEQSRGAYRHINPIVTYESGMRATDLAGSCTVDDSSKAAVDAFGVMEAKREGTVRLTYQTATGLVDTAAVEIVP